MDRTSLRRGEVTVSSNAILGSPRIREIVHEVALFFQRVKQGSFGPLKGGVNKLVVSPPTVHAEIFHFSEFSTIICVSFRASITSRLLRVAMAKSPRTKDQRWLIEENEGLPKSRARKEGKPIWNEEEYGGNMAKDALTMRRKTRSPVLPTAECD